MDLITLAVAKNYTNKVAAGITTAKVEGNSIILTLVDGSEAICTLPAPANGKDGIDGLSVTNMTIDKDGSLLCHMSDESVIDAGKVPSIETEYSYNDLKDKPFGDNEEPQIIIPQETTVVNYRGYYPGEENYIPLKEGEKYLVTFNGIEYECEGVHVLDTSIGNTSTWKDPYDICLGNPNLLYKTYIIKDEYPFMITNDYTQEEYPSGYDIRFNEDIETATISIVKISSDVQTLNNRFLSDEIKNPKISYDDLLDKPFYEKYNKTVLTPKGTPMIETSGYTHKEKIEVGKEYLVTFRGQEYKCIGQPATVYTRDHAYLGNFTFYYDQEFIANEYPFLVINDLTSNGYASYQYFGDNLTKKDTIEINRIDSVDLKKLEEKFIPNEYATKEYVDEAIAGIDAPEIDLTNYYTKEEVNNTISNISRPKSHDGEGMIGWYGTAAAGDNLTEAYGVTPDMIRAVGVGDHITWPSRVQTGATENTICLYQMSYEVYNKDEGDYLEAIDIKIGKSPDVTYTYVIVGNNVYKETF